MNNKITIIGAGLAGCTIAWQLYLREIPFLLVEDNEKAASSLAAAGMLAPVTGKAFNPSWRIDEFYQPALDFYYAVESILETQIWYPYPVIRLFFDKKDRAKFEKKAQKSDTLQSWVSKVSDQVDGALTEYGAVTWKGSGRLAVKHFVEATREFFQKQGFYIIGTAPEGITIHSKGAIGLTKQDPLKLPQRCAKGEILTIQAPDLDESRILSRGTWIVPTGKNDGTFLAGANYDWDDLTNTPTETGKAKAEKGIRSLIDIPFKVIEHVAGVRPIIRRSEPVIGAIPNKKDEYIMNGLGSKGVLYAPETANILLDHILGGGDIPAGLGLDFG